MRQPKVLGKVTVNLPSLHPGQKYVLENLRRFNFIVCGRRWRKTTLAMRVTLKGAGKWPGALQGVPWLWTAPTYDQVRIAWDETKRAVGHIVEPVQTTMSMLFPNGTINKYRSLENPDNARGHTAFGVVGDELPFCEEGAYKNVLRPMLMDTGGPLFGIGTPNGKNWYWLEVQRALLDIQEKGDASEYAVFQAPTLGCRIEDGQLIREPHPLENPHILFSELQDMYRTMTERHFRQEIMAEFMDDGGGVFTKVRSAIDSGRKPMTEGIPGTRYQLGVDFGKTHDFTVLSVLDTYTMRQVYVDRFSGGIGWERIYDRVTDVAKRFCHARTLIDSTGQLDTQYEELRRRGVNVVAIKFTNSLKEDMVNHLALLIEKGKDRGVSLLDIPQQTFELESFQYLNDPGALTKMGAPKGEGYFDDCVVALMLCAWGNMRIQEYSAAYQAVVSKSVSEYADMSIW